MALHARAVQRRRLRDPDAASRKRQLSLRAVLLILALVPSAAMIGVWAVNSDQLYNNWHSVSEHNTATVQGASPLLTLFYELQTERQLSAAALAAPADYKARLDQQRKLTDAIVSSFEALPDSLPASIESGIRQVDEGLRQLDGYRTAVDRQTVTQQQVYDDYTALIATDLVMFTNLSNSGVADVNYLSRPVVESLWGMEMLARENAVLTPSIVGGSVTSAQRSQIAQLIGAQQLIYEDEVVPTLPAAEGAQYQKLLAGSAWTQKTQVEQAVLSASGTGTTALSATFGQQWQQSIVAVTSQLQDLNLIYASSLTDDTSREVHSMALTLIFNSVLGALGVVLVFVISVLLTGMLRRRIQELRAAAVDLQVRLPEAVERLRRGESVDTEAEFPEIEYGTDELGLLGQALNAARGTALETAVGQVEQYRGFERLLQRIARRTQLLIGLQAKKISEMERRYEDSDMLEGLFDLDHLTARLRRYEENLVILGGGQPQRRWRKPVTLLDVLRSAQGEVQDYQRIRIEIEGRMWLAERAVGAMVHVLAELMENAVAFSKPPTPVEVSASRVGHGLAVEIEDRGMGMAPEQFDEANALMANPPRMDAVSRADDARLGMYVVARLAAGLGVKVEFRPSSFGGTRVVVLVPEELVLDQGPASDSVTESLHSVPPRLTALVSGASEVSEVFSTNGNSRPAPVLVAVRNTPQDPEPEPAPRLSPLPRRVRLASLATELREPRESSDDAAEDQPGSQTPPGSAAVSRSSATIGAFQRQSRIARTVEEADDDPGHNANPVSRAEPTREEDRR